MNRVNKKKLVAIYSKIFADFEALFFVKNLGMSVLESTSMRSQFSQAGSRFLFIKNSLARIALGNTVFDSISASLSGPIVLIASNDPISTSKLVVSLHDGGNKIKLITASAFGEQLDKDGIISLSRMPTQDEVRAQVVCLLNAAASKIVITVNEPARQLSRVVKHYSKK